jgi:CheY-like chemotaxis protein
LFRVHPFAKGPRRVGISTQDAREGDINPPCFRDSYYAIVASTVLNNTVFLLQGSPLSSTLLQGLPGCVEDAMATPTRVLLIDDELTFLQAIANLLGRCGYDVLQASGAQQALAMLRDGPPIQVAVSDVRMPEMYGTDLVREIARVSPETACVLMTGGWVDPAEIPPDVPLLRKPIFKNDLIATIQQALPPAVS